MAVIGIDPGGSGGIAVIYGRERVEAYKMPATERDVFELLSAIPARSPDNRRVAYIERVNAMPSQGVSSTFKFGVSYGGLRMACIAAGLRLEDVPPGVWQKPFRLPSQSAVGNTAKKNAHKARAQELFPQLKITHAVADALLIAEYGRRQQLK